MRDWPETVSPVGACRVGHEALQAVIADGRVSDRLRRQATELLRLITAPCVLPKRPKAGRGRRYRGGDRFAGGLPEGLLIRARRPYQDPRPFRRS